MSKFSLFFLIPSYLILTIGCGGSSGPANQLTGKVTMGGKGVSGMILLKGSDGKEKMGPLINGEFKVDDPMLGEVQVAIKGVGPAVVGTPLTKAVDVKDAPKLEAPVNPPAKYADFKTSGLKVEVKAGKNTKDFELTP